MLKRALFASAILVIPAMFMHAAVTPAGAGPNVKPKVKVAPQVRIRVVKPKIRLKVDPKRLARNKEEKKAKNKKQETATNTEQTAVPAPTGAASSRRGQDLTDPPPLPLSRPWIAALDAGKAGRWAEFSETGRIVQQLRELGLLRDPMDIFGAGVLGPPSQQPGARGNRERFGGNQSDAPIVAELSPTIRTEGAPDVASFFAGDIPGPGAGSGGTAPDGPGERHTGATRPQPGQVPAGTRPSDVPDPRGMASDGLPTATAMMEPDSGYTHTGTTVDPETGADRDSYTSDDGQTTVVYTQRPVNEKLAERTAVRVRYDRDVKIVERFRQNSSGRYVRQGTPQYSSIFPKKSDQPLPIDGGSDTSDWSHLCGGLIPSYMCRQRASVTPMDMLGQPDGDNGEGGARGASYTVSGFLDRGAVTDTGDSGFSTIPGPGVTPGEGLGGGGPTPLPGPCTNC